MFLTKHSWADWEHYWPWSLFLPSHENLTICEKVDHILNPSTKRIKTHMRCITQKGPNHANRLSHCHSKRWMGVHGCAHSSFGMTPTFYIILGKSRCHKKKKDGRSHTCPSFFRYDYNSGCKGPFLHNAVHIRLFGIRAKERVLARLWLLPHSIVGGLIWPRNVYIYSEGKFWIWLKEFYDLWVISA